MKFHLQASCTKLFLFYLPLGVVFGSLVKVGGGCFLLRNDWVSFVEGVAGIVVIFSGCHFPWIGLTLLGKFEGT